MSGIKENKNDYVNMPFSSKSTKVDFYSYFTVSDIIKKKEKNEGNLFKCRIVGVLESVNGQFYISNFRKTSSEESIKLKVSMCYVKSTLQSSVKPYPVQILGTIQWKKEPILYATILQVLSIKTAVSLGETLSRIAQNFTAIETA